MNSYEVTLIEKREKTLLVNAECKNQALIRAQNEYVYGGVSLDDCELCLEDIVIEEANAGVIVVDPEACFKSNIEFFDDDVDCVCSEEYECEKCINRNTCAMKQNLCILKKSL